ncbi:MAG: hypothetical protein ACREOG_05615 [Gemmatimonadaceae bacterium]
MAVRGMRSEVAVVQHISIADTVFAGALAGTIGGLLLALFAMGTAVMMGADILSPFRLTGATFLGAAALDGGAGIILYGLLLHLATSMAWGILFAAILPREAPVGVVFVAGLVYGLLVMLVMWYLVLPVANPTLRDATTGTTSFTIEHLIYGGSLAAVPMLRSWFTTHIE